MANTFKFIDMVAREALSIAHEKTSFIATTDRQYDDSYGKSGAKIGSVLRVRSPNKFTSTIGSAIVVQDIVETTQTITLATQRHVAMKISGADLTLNTDSPKEVAAFSKRFIEPAAAGMMSEIEGDYLAFATKATFNVAGTAGTALTDLAVPGQARAKLNQGLAPKDMKRNIQMDSVTMSSLVNGSAAYFNPPNEIASQYKEGLIARRAMADFYENERVYAHANSSDVVGLAVNAAAGVLEGASSVAIDGATVAPSVGSVFTFDTTKAVHPETKQAYSNLQQFVVTSGTTTTLLNFSPAVYASGAQKNVDALPLDNAAMVFVGAATTPYVQSLMYHKEAFQFVTAPFAQLDTPDKFTQRMQDGIGMAVWLQGDIRNFELILRIDILYGYAALRPEWASRMIGAAS